MKYRVTHAGIRPGPIGLSPDLTLEEALADACRLISRGEPNVTIQEAGGSGDKTISGDDLVACCRGEKKLKPDLSAI